MESEFNITSHWKIKERRFNLKIDNYFWFKLKNRIDIYISEKIIILWYMISSVTTPVSPGEIMTYSLIVVVTLFVFLVVKEIFRSEAQERPTFQKFVISANIGILPLLLVFVTLVAYKAISL